MHESLSLSSLILHVIRSLLMLYFAVTAMLLLFAGEELTHKENIPSWEKEKWFILAILLWPVILADQIWSNLKKRFYHKQKPRFLKPR